jgi:hypothetical protein
MRYSAFAGANRARRRWAEAFTNRWYQSTASDTHHSRGNHTMFWNRKKQNPESATPAPAEPPPDYTVAEETADYVLYVFHPWYFLRLADMQTLRDRGHVPLFVETRMNPEVPFHVVCEKKPAATTEEAPLC